MPTLKRRLDDLTEMLWRKLNRLNSYLNSHTGNDDIHVTTTQKSYWNNKVDIDDIPTSNTELDNDEGYITEHDAIPNTALNTYEKQTTQPFSIQTLINNFHKRVIDDGGTIHNYIGVSDVTIKKSGNIINNIIIEEGIVKDIQLRYIELDDIPNIPTNKLINYNQWTTAHW